MLPTETESPNFRPFAPHRVGWETLGPSIAWTIIAFLAVILRWYSRMILSQTFGAEDILIMLSMVFSVAVLVMVALQFHLASSFVENPVILSKTTKFVIVEQCLYSASTNLTKASLIVTYLRVFSGEYFKKLRFACHAVLPLLAGSLCYAVFAGIFLCSPVAKLWQPLIPGYCYDSLTYFIASASINIGLDFVVWVLPILELQKLKLPRRQLIGLMLLFALGGLICVLGILRLVMVVVWMRKGQYSRSGRYSIIWTSIEANAAILCASLLTIKPLIKKHFPMWLSSGRTPKHRLCLPIIPTGDSRWMSSTTCEALKGKGSPAESDAMEKRALGSISVTYETRRISEHRRFSYVQDWEDGCREATDVQWERRLELYGSPGRTRTQSF